MSRLKALFVSKKNGLLNIYFTAGYPKLADTARLLKTLDRAGVDLVEVGIPYSDPLADGPTIQASGQQALQNGMTLKLLFEQLEAVRPQLGMPVLLMGYLNQVMQYGEEAFLQKCQSTGIDGLILPDLPLEVYEQEYKTLFEQYELPLIFLITPQTEAERIRKIDAMSNGFIYMVSDSSVTGARHQISATQIQYFSRIRGMKLQSPCLIGFGIASAESFQQACQFANGAIIGSAFIKAIGEAEDVEAAAARFVHSIRPEAIRQASNSL